MSRERKKDGDDDDTLGGGDGVIPAAGKKMKGRRARGNSPSLISWLSVDRLRVEREQLGELESKEEEKNGATDTRYVSACMPLVGPTQHFMYTQGRVSPGTLTCGFRAW
jgi:hypothetical protein